MTRKLLVGGVLKDEFLCLEWPKEIMPQATADMVMGLVQKKFDHRQPQLPVVVYWKGTDGTNHYIEPRQNLYEFFQQNVNLYATFIPV